MVKKDLEMQFLSELKAHTFFDYDHIYSNSNYRLLASTLNHREFKKNHIVIGSGCSKVLTDFQKAFQNFIEKNGYGLCVALDNPKITLSSRNVQKNLDFLIKNANDIPAPLISSEYGKHRILSRNVVLFLNDPTQAIINNCDSIIYSKGSCSLLIVSCVSNNSNNLRTLFVNGWKIGNSFGIVKDSSSLNNYDMMITLPPYSQSEVKSAIEFTIKKIFKERFECELEIDNKFLHGVLHGYLFDFNNTYIYLEPILRNAFLKFEIELDNLGVKASTVILKFIPPNKFSLTYQLHILIFELYNTVLFTKLVNKMKKKWILFKNANVTDIINLSEDIIYLTWKLESINLCEVQSTVMKLCKHEISRYAKKRSICFKDICVKYLQDQTMIDLEWTYNDVKHKISIDLIQKLYLLLNDTACKTPVKRKIKKKIKKGSITDKQPNQIKLSYFDIPMNKWRIKTMNSVKHDKCHVLKIAKELGISTEKIKTWDIHTHIYR